MFFVRVARKANIKIEKHMYPSHKFSKVMDKFLVSFTKSNESNNNSEERDSKLTHGEINLLLMRHHAQFATFL